MANIPETRYPGKITAASASYPYGEARNITAPSDGRGTPWEQAGINDIYGFQQALLIAAGITPSGVPDTATNSQYLQALQALFVSSNTVTALVARIEALEDRVVEDTKIGEVVWVERHFESAAAFNTYKGYGTWERALRGRVAVGWSDLLAHPEEFKTVGLEYGSAAHRMTVEEMPAHSHILKQSYDNGSVNAPAGYPSNDSENWSGRYMLEDSVSSTGGNKPHNNLQPSKTLDCWKRIA